jgi:hypothetical protein
MNAWSSRPNQTFARPRGSAWYSVETKYSTMPVPAKMLAPTMSAAPPRRAACHTSSGSEASASSSARP